MEGAVEFHCNNLLLRLWTCVEIENRDSGSRFEFLRAGTLVYNATKERMTIAVNNNDEFLAEAILALLLEEVDKV